MSDTNDPFLHHPELRGKIADPLGSRFRHFDLALLDAEMQAAGVPSPWRATDEAREASRVQTLQQRPEQDLWVFGYGSLIWDPGMLFSEVRIGQVQGLSRRFCLRSLFGRGSHDKPGLMVGLDRGGQCESLAFRIPEAILEQETRLLWQREMLRNTYQPTYVPVQTVAGVVQALTFVVNPSTDNYIASLELDEAARCVATGAGLYGTCLDYVDNLARHLREFGIEDAMVFELWDKSRRLCEQG